MNKIILIFQLIIILYGFDIYCNNIQISNISITEQDAISHSCKVQFNISWENSWRTSTGAMNWDAAWVFVKYKTGINGEWKHATLSTNSNEHFAVAGSTIDAVNDGKGVFVYRSYMGTGNNYFNGLKLKWNYGIDSVNENDTIQIKVIGIEMVYVPQGSFFAGDNNASSACFKQGSNDNDPWYISSENEINVTGGTGSGTGIGQTNAEFYYQAYYGLPEEESTGSSFIIPINFPKGFAPFYCMKYEISQGQYTEFLNMLTRQQQNSRTKTDISPSDIANYYVMTNTDFENSKNTIVCPQTNNGISNPIHFSTITPERACNYLGWTDFTAILDWSGIRPMTELEFEKACRGTQQAVNDEYAWGNSNIFSSSYVITNDGVSNETISNSGFSTGNSFYSNTNGGILGPIRCGIFAGSTFNNSRQETGATYYGIYEMSGNIEEFTITVANANGRTFTSANGDGMLYPNGDSNVINWPGIDANGSGMRGGNWESLQLSLKISERNGASKALTGRSKSVGGRGVRLAN